MGFLFTPVLVGRGSGLQNQVPIILTTILKSIQLLYANFNTMALKVEYDMNEMFFLNETKLWCNSFFNFLFLWAFMPCSLDIMSF